MTRPAEPRWYLRERYAALLVIGILAMVAGVLGVLARGQAGNEPLDEPTPSSSATTTSSTAS